MPSYTEIPSTPAEASHAKRQLESLTDQGGDSYWSGPMSIGTPAKNFVIDFDSECYSPTSPARIRVDGLHRTAGSADLWVPSVNCTSSTCSSKNKYNSSASSTSKSKSGNLKIMYGDGSSVSGPIVADTVTVAGIKATGQSFSPVTTLSPSFGSQAIDGILGMGYPSLSHIGTVRCSPTFLRCV